jgi:hypothetical protein
MVKFGSLLVYLPKSIQPTIDDYALISDKFQIVTLSQPYDRDIAYMDAGTYDLPGAKIMTVHPEHSSLFHIHLNVTLPKWM